MMTDTELPVLNTALLEEAADYAINHEKYGNPDNVIWDQRYYHWVSLCNTFMCIAGITCELAGGQWINNNIGAMSSLHTETDDDRYTLLYGEIPITSAGARAKRLLGLTDEEVTYLFSGGYAGADELRTRVKRISNGELR
jgi:hypothetical protein